MLVCLAPFIKQITLIQWDDGVVVIGRDIGLLEEAIKQVNDLRRLEFFSLSLCSFSTLPTYQIPLDQRMEAENWTSNLWIFEMPTQLSLFSLLFAT